MNQDKRWRHHVKRFMQRFGFETTAQAEEIMTAGPILWNGLKHLDVRGRRYVADYLPERRKEKDAQLGAAFKKHYAEQGTRALAGTTTPGRTMWQVMESTAHRTMKPLHGRLHSRRTSQSSWMTKTTCPQANSWAAAA
jgi:hypothetical protein